MQYRKRRSAASETLHLHESPYEPLVKKKKNLNKCKINVHVLFYFFLFCGCFLMNDLSQKGDQL